MGKKIQDWKTVLSGRLHPGAPSVHHGWTQPTDPDSCASLDTPHREKGLSDESPVVLVSSDREALGQIRLKHRHPPAVGR